MSSPLISIFLFGAFVFASAQPIQVRSAAEILRSYVEDFRGDPAAAEPATFGIRIRDEGGSEWQEAVGDKKEGDGQRG